jgi:hypothetical protein
MNILGKRLEFFSTAPWSAKYGGFEMVLYIRMALAILAKHPVDMLVFSMYNKNTLQVRSAGYFLNDEGRLDETTVLYRCRSLPVDTFWLKIDDQGEFYAGTFLFPEDY